MENKILKEELVRISEIMGIQNKNILNESLLPTIERQLGHDIADAVEIGFGRQLAKDLEITLSQVLKSAMNVIDRNGAKFLKSASGNEVPMSKFAQILKDVADGKLSGAAIDEELKYLPRNLADGSEFREPIKRELRAKSAIGAQQGGGHTPNPAPHTGPGGGSSHTPGPGGGGLGNTSSKSVDDLINAYKSDPLFSDILSNRQSQKQFRTFIDSEITFKGLTVEEIYNNPTELRSWLTRAKQASKESGQNSSNWWSKVGDFMESSVSKRRAKQVLFGLIVALVGGFITIKQLRDKVKQIIGTDTPEENNTTPQQSTGGRTLGPNDY